MTASAPRVQSKGPERFRRPWLRAGRAGLPAAALLGLLAGCLAPPGGVHARFGYGEEHGLRVLEVPPGGPAERAGLRPGDRVVAIDGRAVREMSAREVVAALRGPAGSVVRLRVQRGPRLLELAVRRAPYSPRSASSRPPPPPGASPSSSEPASSPPP